MDVDIILSDALSALHLRDCILTGTGDVLMEDRVFEEITYNESNHNDDQKIDKTLFKRVINAITLITLDSKCPDITKNDFIMFLKVTKIFVLSFIFI